MLKFFRKIRRSLIESGSAQKYTFYAIGEIALIVIGILIALQVNIWSQRKQLNNQEEIYLNRLHSDLLAMKQFYDFNLPKSVEDFNHSLTSFRALEKCALEEGDKEIFDLVLASHQVLSTGISKSSAYDEMISNGAFARLKNDSLKIAEDLYTGLQQYKDYIEYFRQELGRASQIIMEHVIFSISEEYEWTANYEFSKLCNNVPFRNAILEVMDSRGDKYMQIVSLVELIDKTLNHFE